MKLSPMFVAVGALLLAAPPAAAQKPEALEDAAPAEDSQALLAALQESVAEMRRHLFAPGPTVAGWNEGGADPDADLRAAGPDDHYYLITSSEGTVVTMMTRRAITDFAPDGWRVVDTYGSAAAALDNPFVEFIPLSARYVMAVRSNGRRMGGVDCNDPIANAVFFEVPSAPESADDEAMPMFFRLAVLATEGQITCTRYDRDGTGYRMRNFLPDGHSLPQLDNAEERVTIVPAAPLDRVLRYIEPADPSSTT